jgi:hypothetical protein
MGGSDKPDPQRRFSVVPSRQAATGSSKAPGTQPVAPRTTRPADLAGAVVSTAREAAFEKAKEAFLEKRPYLKFAFSNPYNLSLFIGGIAASVLTLNPVLAIATLGLEGIWLLHAPESKRLRHLLWDPRFDKLRKALAAEERAERLKNVGESERERVENLVARQEEIQVLAGRNPSFTGDLLRNELVKTDRLVDAFVDMAVTSGRYEEYLASVDLDGLDRDRARWEREVRSGKEGDPQVDLARKNLSIIMRRLDKMKEIQRYLTVARGQLDLIENSFQLIADQIVTMQSPQELSGQLNELLDGVESIRQTAVETEQILNTLGTGA